MYKNGAMLLRCNNINKKIQLYYTVSDIGSDMYLDADI